MAFAPARFFDGLKYVGRVPAQRAAYYVYGAPDRYVLLTRRRNKDGTYGHNLSEVPLKAVEAVRDRFAGQTVETKDLRARVRAPYWHRYGALVSLVARGDARVASRAGQSLRFRIRK